MRSAVGMGKWCSQRGQTRRFASRSPERMISAQPSHLAKTPRATDLFWRAAAAPAEPLVLRHHATGGPVWRLGSGDATWGPARTSIRRGTFPSPFRRAELDGAFPLPRVSRAMGIGRAFE